MRSRFFCILAVVIACTGCAATSQDVVLSLNERYDERSVDSMVLDLGPPAETFEMSDGSTVYQCIVANHTNVSTSHYGGAANTYFCKVRAVVRQDGMVRTVSTEDASNGFGESLCARRFHLARKL